MPFSTRFLRLSVLTSAVLCAAVQAQLVDDVELRREGADAVVRVRFVTPVQYRRTLTTRSGEFGQVFYDILPAPDTLSLITSERRIPPGARALLLVMRDEVAGPTERNRKLELRFPASTTFSVRSGPGNRNIEIVLSGKGPLVTSAAGKPVPTPSGAFSIVLESGASPDVLGRVPVPAVVQDYVVSVRPRVVDGQRTYETVVSGIASREDAVALLDALRPRFPQAALDKPFAAAVPGQPAAQAPQAQAPQAQAPQPQARGAPAPGAQAARPQAPGAQAPGVPASGTPAAGTPALGAQPRAEELLAQARQAMEQGDYNLAIGKLDELLGMPPNAASQEAQELIAFARWRQGDPGRARAEFDLYLKLYPEGPGAARAREALLTLAPAPPPITEAAQGVPGQPAVISTINGSVSSFYYGGQSKIRTQEFQDSPLGGLPQLVSDATLSATDQRQLVSNVDLNWRRKDADVDTRLVVRDTKVTDLARSNKSYNRLTAAYVDYRSQSTGLLVRAGRQSPLGAGVMARFDGVQVGYQIAPKWRVNVLAGQPSDILLDSKRYFYGASVDADAITSRVGGSFYVIEDRIDGETDRRAVGSELRYQDGALSGTALLDYDIPLRGLNIASVQGTWQSPDNTVVNMLYDRRATPVLMLGNGLFLQNPVLGIQARRVQDLLASESLAALRQQVRDTTAFSTQGMLGATRPVNANWQAGADVRLTKIGALLPVADILPNGQPGTGNIWSLGGQVIGTNLYSSRDTHVLVGNLLKAPTYRGTLLSYNNSSTLSETWLLEPALRVYRQNDASGIRTQRWAPGLRITYRPLPRLAIESEVSMEFSQVSGPARTESSRRVFYNIGLRYEL